MDVFASANTSNMDQVVDGGAASDPEDFVTNLLEIAVPAGNEAGVTGLDDFANADLLIGLCAGGCALRRVRSRGAGQRRGHPSIDTNEPDVRSLLTKVEAGDLDAGIVYVTDVMAAGDSVEGVEIPADDNVVATYLIAGSPTPPTPTPPMPSWSSCCPTRARRSCSRTASARREAAAGGSEAARQQRTPG